MNRKNVDLGKSFNKFKEEIKSQPMSIFNNEFCKTKKMEKTYLIVGVIDGKVQNYIYHYFKTSLHEEALAILDGAKVNVQTLEDRDCQELILLEVAEIEKRLI